MKNKNRKKMTPQQAIATGVLVLGGAGIALGLMGCKPEPDPECPCDSATVHAPENPCSCVGEDYCDCSVFLRAFDLTFLSKTIVLQDATGGTTELSAAIRTKVQAALNLSVDSEGDFAKRFNAIHANTGTFVIVIEGGTLYEYGKTNGYNVLFHKDFVLDAGVDAEWIRDDIRGAVGSMQCAPGCECSKDHASAPSQSNIRMANAVPQYNRAMQQRDNRIASKQVRQRLG